MPCMLGFTAAHLEFLSMRLYDDDDDLYWYTIL